MQDLLTELETLIDVYWDENVQLINERKFKLEEFMQHTLGPKLYIASTLQQTSGISV